MGDGPIRSQVRYNAERDPMYRPYCLRCTGLVRMAIVEPFLWRCQCGAMHDERTPLVPARQQRPTCIEMPENLTHPADVHSECENLCTSGPVQAPAPMPTVDFLTSELAVCTLELEALRVELLVVTRERDQWREAAESTVSRIDGLNTRMREYLERAAARAADGT